MITIEAEEADLAAVLEAVLPAKVAIENGEITALVDGKTLRLNKLKLELETEVAYDRFHADIACRLDGGHAHLEAEIR